MNYEDIIKARDCILSKSVIRPEIGLVLGSGLGGFVDEIKIVDEITYDEIPGFPKSTVSGHKGRFVLGKLGELSVMIMDGRVHYYEGYPMDLVVLPVRCMALMGCKTIILTNAAGGINKAFTGGTLMCINDQISTFVPSPLIGKNLDELGTRFPDMSEIYKKDLIKLAHETADELGIDLADGVYVQTTGPNYESPAEVRMFALLGADAVGMSTACEAMVLNHMGVRVCGISCITNAAAGISDKPLDHAEVKATADRVSGEFKKLIKEILIKI